MRKPTGPLSSEDANRLVHELQVHQIELELQNDELRKTRNALEAALERYTDLSDFAPIGYLSLEADGTIRSCNLAAAVLLEKDRIALLGQPLGLFIADDRRAALSDTLHGLFTVDVPGSCEIRIERRETADRVVRLDGSPSSNGVPARVVLHDITEIREADLNIRLRSAALDAAGEPIMISDRNGAICWTNKAFCTLTGYEPNEILGRNPRELIRSGSHDALFYRTMWETINAGKIWRGELTNRRKSGELYAEAMTITPLTDDAGVITHFVAIKRDLSDDKRNHALMLQSQKMESVGRLAGGVAHDFNNLLTVISGITEFALSEADTSTQLHADLEEIGAAANRAALLTRQLLAFSRRQILHSEAVDLNALVTEMHQLLRRLIDEHIDIALDLAVEPPVVFADPGQLSQVVMNLAVNARDAMRGGGTLTIATRVLGFDTPMQSPLGEIPAGQYAALVIRDTGEGIPPDAVSRIFEPFFTSKAVGEGTGLGLSMVIGVVTQGNGFVQVRSAPGEGSEFTVLLPPIYTADQVPVVAQAPPHGGHETILVVDDEVALLRVTARILERAGYRVISAASGKEALAMFDAQEAAHRNIALVLTDVVMPGMSGPQLVAALRERRADVLTLFVSGYTDDTVLRLGVDGNLSHLLSKPYTAAQLTAAVRSLLDAGVMPPAG